MLITPEKLYKQRRNFLKLGAGALISSSVLASKLSALNFTSDTNPNKLEISDEELATNYVNFYEFSTDKKRLYHWHKISILKIGKSISVEK